MERSIIVTDVPETNRFTITVDGVQAGFAAYTRTPDLIVFTHTEIDPGFEGQGVGGALARQALDQVRADGIPLIPQCPFIKRWIEGHPDYQDLVYNSTTTQTD
jgi:predicted GNAT family acetyltransferase